MITNSSEFHKKLNNFHTYKLVIEYNGKKFCGSQKQNGLNTVESVLEEKIKIILGKHFELMFASRTDSGVHSFGNVVRLKTEYKILNKKKFLSQLNFLLPEDLQVRNILKVDNNFNPRKDVKTKVYQYLIFDTTNAGYPVLYKDYVWFVKCKLSLKKMKQSAEIVQQQKDFRFVTTKEYTETQKSTCCDIKQIKINKWNSFIRITFVGNRFLQRMIRNIVGLLVETGRGKISLEELKKKVIHWQYCKTRPAPANGLCLIKIKY